MSLAAALCYHPLFLGGLFGVKICPSCRVQFPDESRACSSDGTELRQLGEGDPRFGTVANDQYLFLDLLGRGGMGVVYRAHQLDLERDVAIKILSGPDLRDKEWVTRFEHEARVIAQLKDEHTIKPIERGKLPNGEMFIAMELIEGPSLARILAGGPLTPDRVANIMIQICDALEEAHAKGLVHRDLKPSNVMVEPRKNGELVKLLDFGLAKKIDRPSTDRISWANHFYGTPEYMAPEQYDSDTFGEIGPQTDIYALGVMMYELLTKTLPFQARDASTWMYKHVNETPPRLPYVAFDRIVRCCMAKSQGERYANVAELRADLERAASDRTIGAPDGLDRPPMPKRSFGLMRELARGATAQFLAFAFMLLTLGLVIVHEMTKDAPLIHVAPASITVNSNPPGAAILIDGEPTGLTTPTVLEVLVKDRTVELSVKKDQKIASRAVRLESGKRESVTLVLGARTE